MATDTAIEWTHFPGYKGKSWNPVTGCTKIAQGCKHCYAETLANRFWKARAFTDVQTHADRLDEPLRRRKPTCYFVNSMSDLFHEAVPIEFIAAVYGVMAACPQHLFIILTKRPKRMWEFNEWLAKAARENVVGLSNTERAVAVEKAWAHDTPTNGLYLRGFNTTSKHARGPWPLPNVIHGYSAANQADLDAGIADLLATPSALRCLSLEPLIGPVDVPNLKSTIQFHMKLDIAGALANKGFHGFTENGKPLHPEKVEAELRARQEAGEKYFPMGDCPEFSPQTGCPGHPEPGIDWVITGGESGPDARPCDVAWVRSIVQQCKAASVPCFVKQVGSNPVWHEDDEWVEGPLNGRYVVADRKGGNPDEWEPGLRIRQFPAINHENTKAQKGVDPCRD